ncbi:hypothetical protein [Jeotgalibacillus salarius]|uniref:Uncharacterized protein n=1 Tax=Jeotgalibacillus salarius TaxID=546023 RepID=A0A4Y8LBP6_9BACL|nr:hypothetical protein [Jeotgalibacillus salarius]TFD99803.1 hypothetical protein E2626_13560 [Jeotgalibacillus salarius]
MTKAIKVCCLIGLFVAIAYDAVYDFDLLFYYISFMFFLSVVASTAIKNKYRTNIFFIISLSCLAMIFMLYIEFVIGALAFVALILIQFFYAFYYITYEKEAFFK